MYWIKNPNGKREGKEWVQAGAESFFLPAEAINSKNRGSLAHNGQAPIFMLPEAAP